jgi:hypothetical protein
MSVEGTKPRPNRPRARAAWMIWSVLGCLAAPGCKSPSKDRRRAPEPEPAASTGPCVATFRPTAAGPVPREVLARELVARCPRSSIAHTVLAFERLAVGDEAAARTALTEALRLDREWDDGSRGHAKLVSAWLAARAPDASGRGLRMTAANATPLRQVMSIPGVTSGSYASPGIDPRVSGMIDHWIDFTGTIASIAVSQGRAGGDVMWIPGVTDGHGGQGHGQRPLVTIVQEYRPPEVTLVPTGTVEGDAAECQRETNDSCRAEHKKNDDVLWQCVVDCVGAHRGDDAAVDRCTKECDSVFQHRKREIDEWCRRELAKCTPSYSSTPGTTPTTMGSHVSVITAADPCAAHTDCATCTGHDPCGWCASSRLCMAGTAAGAAACTSGWQPFPSSCSDPCIGLTTCQRCTAQECGWCSTNASCYVGTPAAPTTGECSTGWRPYPTMCP